PPWGPRAPHPSMFRRALLNLVQNALAAMPQGGTLILQGQRTASAGHLRVQDTGSGIAAATLAQIFEPLYTPRPGGTGLGLYLVQEIVTAHGGQITVESVEGQGTTFTITLPVALDTAPAWRRPLRCYGIQTGWAGMVFQGRHGSTLASQGFFIDFPGGARPLQHP